MEDTTNQEYKITPSGLIVPGYITEKPERPTVFSLFSGCGGMDLGFIQAGFEVVGANEFDAAAALTYMTNLGSYPINIHYINGPADKERLNAACEKYVFGSKRSGQEPNFKSAYPTQDTAFGIYNKAVGSGFSGSGWIRNEPDAAPVRNFWFGDVRKLRGQDILDTLGLKQGNIDCVCGGPPCQGFSAAGKQNIADPRNNLVYEFGRIIVELHPKTFVMENVPAIVDFFDPDGVPVLDKLTLMLSDGGYGKWENIKKAMLMQTGCAAGIRSARGNQSIKSHQKAAVQKSSENDFSEYEQMTMF